MEINRYQELAAVTQPDVGKHDLMMHALHGMAGEVGEIHSLFQKVYQGHSLEHDHLVKEVGDLMWFAAEMATALDVDLNEICEKNIDKLRKRYPNGFEVERSIHRVDGDI